MIKLNVIVFYEGETESILINMLKQYVNNELINITYIHNEVITFSKEKKESDKYHSNFNNIISILSEYREKYDYKDDKNIKAVYLFDKVHLDKLKDKSFDYVNEFKDDIIFVSCYKTLDEQLHKYFLDTGVLNNKKINKTKTRKCLIKLAEKPLRKTQVIPLLQIIKNSIVMNDSMKIEVDEIFIDLD